MSDAVSAARTGHPTSYRVECHAPWGRHYEPLPGAGFHIVLEGSAWLIDPGAAPIALGVGDVVLFPHGHAHGMADDPATPLQGMLHAPEHGAPTERRAVRIGPDHADRGGISTVMLCGMYRFHQQRPHPLLKDLPKVVHFPTQLGRHRALRTSVDLLATELDTPRSGSDAAVTALLDLLLIHLLRAWFDDNTQLGWGAALTDPVARAALRAIHDEPARPWTVEGLGAIGGMSRAAFARRFKQLIGQGPLGYLTWWRMTLAADLLIQSDAPLSTICRQVGYSSEFAFAHAFRREYGMAPGRYRTTRTLPERSAQPDSDRPGADEQPTW